MVKNGDTIKNASKIVAVSRKTGERWVKEYNEKGIDGLLSDYSNCGLESELTDEMLEILHYYITHSDKGYTIKDVQDLIYGLFKIKFSYNHTWFITRKKLELNYGKPFIRYNARTEEDMELFKKKLKIINTNHRMLAFMDETACQSVTNVRRILYDSNTKNIQVHCGECFKINVVGFMGVNCNSYMETNTRGDSINFVKALCRFRMENMINEEVKHLIEDAITNPNLDDESIKKKLAQKSLHGMDLINKVNNELYNEKSTNQESIVKAKKILNKEDSNNPNKIKKEKENRLLSNLDNSIIREVLSFEIPIDLVLDNAKIHSSDLTLATFEILNINPIFLPVRSPDLNPIEDLWRIIKDRIYKTYYNTLNELIEIFEGGFRDFVGRESLYENWLEDMV